MTNTLLSAFIVLGLLFAVYDQFLMNRLKGETKLEIPLKRQKTIDTWLLIGLLALSAVYGVQNQVSSLTLYLLAGCIVSAAYLAFFRTPRLLLKPNGLFFANLYFDYADIRQVNIAETEPQTADKILVIDLHRGRRLLAVFQHSDDVEKAVAFFDGYKK